MAIKSHMLQAHFARRRELEHERTERTAAVNRYYDHWGKVTSRFENWTKPEYYKNAEEQLQQRREKRDKDHQQAQRRERLRQLFATEKEVYERELLGRSKPKSRKIPATNEQLEKIEQNLKERENIKRKLDLEAKLYGRWRHGVDDDTLLFESKSNNETLAKLNWLDKKIDEQLSREREQDIAQERNLRLQQEISKTEEVQKERQLIREKEIKNIRALQENHMSELKARQAEADVLKEKEKHLRTCLDELEKELELLEESCTLILEPSDISQAYNLRKIKVFIRKRSETFANQIKLCISILERLIVYTTRVDEVKKLLGRYKEHMELEKHTLRQIEAMYESEAKYSLQRLESAWQQQNLERYHEMKQLLNDEQCLMSARMSENLQRQTEIYELRSTHLSAIESSNDKLKQLIAEDELSPRSVNLEVGDSATLLDSNAAGDAAKDLTNYAAKAPDAEGFFGGSSGGTNSSAFTTAYKGRIRSNLQPARPSSSAGLSKVTNSFTNLNLDVWKDMTPARGGSATPSRFGSATPSQLDTQRSLRVVTPDTAERPKYARKRVAWT